MYLYLKRLQGAVQTAITVFRYIMRRHPPDLECAVGIGLHGEITCITVMARDRLAFEIHNDLLAKYSEYAEADAAIDGKEPA